MSSDPDTHTATGNSPVSDDLRDAPSTTATPACNLHPHGRIGLLGLLSIQGIIGYEWLVSGLSKIFGDFVSTFGEQLPDISKAAPGWFKGILDAIVAPAPTFWAVVIAGGELLLGLTLIGAALVWALRFDRLTQRGHNLVLGLIAAAAFFGILLAVSLHLINGNSHPWLIPAGGFDEGIDFDSVMAAMQLVILVTSVRMIQSMRREPYQAPSG